MKALSPHDLLRNNLLRSLPARDWDVVSESMRSVQMPSGFLLYVRDEPIDWIYFPQTAVFSVSRLTLDGGVAEIAMIGREGVAGWDIFMEKGLASAPTTCSMPGEALAMRTNEFWRHVETSSSLRSAFLGYVSRYTTMLAQLIACNRLHRIEQRCARWLLMTADRIDNTIFSLTQERLSMMLGSQRPTLTAVLASLREAGCVGTRRGVLEILDRQRLESLACECYEVCSSIFREDVGLFTTLKWAHAGDCLT